MDSQDKSKALVSALPLELKIEIISWLVLVNGPIIPEVIVNKQADDSDDQLAEPTVLTKWNGERVSHPLTLFSTGKPLRELATKEFWKVNTFCIRTELQKDSALSDCYRTMDDPEVRPYIRKLVMTTYHRKRSHMANKMVDGVVGLRDVESVLAAGVKFPKLQFLAMLLTTVDTRDNSDDGDEEDEVQRCLSAREAQEYLANMMRAIRTLGTVRRKDVCLNQIFVMAGPHTPEPIFIKEHGRVLDAVVWEMLDHAHVHAELS